ncbi:hypothetical protein ACH46_04720 [Gordonia phthalatica]|uniref:Uncharacterized protein n=1 Tax=Gordonia phthalatica TaxID=1136941 RepID=A0A0N7FUC1_9ACTN|nr:hypothetical protein ACH46_04720 [Gordonia phthalatica]
MICAVTVVLGSIHLIDFFWPLMSVVWGGLILGSAWLVLSAVGLARYRRVAGTIIAPILVFVPIAAVLWSGIVNDVQFSMSRTALGEIASSCTPATDVRAGLFRIERVESAGDACLLFLPSGLASSSGLGIFPSGVPREYASHMKIDHYAGDWFTFVRWI